MQAQRHHSLCTQWARYQQSAGSGTEPACAHHQQGQNHVAARVAHYPRNAQEQQTSEIRAQSADLMAQTQGNLQALMALESTKQSLQVRVGMHGDMRLTVAE
jgi:hypothetical protein